MVEAVVQITMWSMGRAQAAFKQADGVAVVKAAIKAHGKFIGNNAIDARGKTILKAVGADSWFG